MICVWTLRVGPTTWIARIRSIPQSFVVVYSSPSTFFTDINAEEPKTASAPFDLIIVDLLLPERNSGVEVIHQVKNILPDLPVILISAGNYWVSEAARKASPTVRGATKILQDGNPFGNGGGKIGIDPKRWRLQSWILAHL